MRKPLRNKTYTFWGGKGELALTPSLPIGPGHLPPSLVRPSGDIWHYTALCCPLISALFLAQGKQIQTLYITYHFPFVCYHQPGFEMAPPPFRPFLWGLLVNVKECHLWLTPLTVRSSTSHPEKHLLFGRMPCRDVLYSCRWAIVLRCISFKRSLFILTFSCYSAHS